MNTDPSTSINALATLLGALSIFGCLVIDRAFFDGQIILGPIVRKIGRRHG